eukprot:57891_1
MSSKRNKRMDPPTTKHSRLRKMKAVDLRDTSAQTKFRNQVDPEKAREIAIKQTESHLERLKRGNTDPLKSLEASNCFPLSIAAFLNNLLDTPVRATVLKDHCNDKGNFEMQT